MKLMLKQASLWNQTQAKFIDSIDLIDWRTALKVWSDRVQPEGIIRKK